MSLFAIANNSSLAVTNSSGNAPLPSVVTMTGTINGQTLTVSGSSKLIPNGAVLNGGSVLSGTVVQGTITANATAGTYLLNQGQTVASTPMTAMLPTLNWTKFINDGTAECYMAMSPTSTGVATTAGIPLQAGSTLDLFVSPANPYVAAITAAGSTKLQMLQGGEFA